MEYQFSRLSSLTLITGALLLLLLPIGKPGTACHAHRFGRSDELTDSYGGPGSDAHPASSDYDDYPYNDSDFYNYPDFGLKHSQKNTVVPKSPTGRPAKKTTTTTTQRPTTSTSTTTTTTTTSTTPATTRRLYKYTRHRITTTTSSTTSAPPAQTTVTNNDSGGSYEIEEYDDTLVSHHLPTPTTTTTSTRRPVRNSPSTTMTAPRNPSTTLAPRPNRRKPVAIANSGSIRNEVRIRPVHKPSPNRIQYTADEDDPLIESASQHSPKQANSFLAAIDHHGYDPLQEYEYSFKGSHQQRAKPPRHQQPLEATQYERTTYEEFGGDATAGPQRHSPHRQHHQSPDRLLFSTDLLSPKFSAHDTDFGYFTPMIGHSARHQQQQPSTRTPSAYADHQTNIGSSSSSSSGGFHPVHIDFASDLNVADLPLESFPGRLKQPFAASHKKPPASSTVIKGHQHQQQQHHKHHHHYHHQHPVKLPSYYSSSEPTPDDADEHRAVLVYAETEPFIPSEQIGSSVHTAKPIFTGYDRFNQAALAAVASPEQIALYNNDVRDHYEALIEHQLKNSANPADRAKYHQFLKAKQDERHEQQQAQRQQQQQHNNRPRPVPDSAGGGKPSAFRPKRPYTTPGLRHFRQPGHQQAASKKAASSSSGFYSQHPYAIDRSYEFPFVK